MCLEPPGQCKRCNLRPSRGGEDAVGPTPTRYRVFRDEEGDGRSEILRDGREKGGTGQGKARNEAEWEKVLRYLAVLQQQQTI